MLVESKRPESKGKLILDHSYDYACVCRNCMEHERNLRVTLKDNANRRKTDIRKRAWA
jgi:hypothetical protein